MFEISARQRLEQFLARNRGGQNRRIEQLTPDASTREYFRVEWKNSTAIACVYGEFCAEKEHSYLDVTNLFRAADLPVAEIYAFDESLGVVVQEDLGDRILRDYLLAADDDERENYINQAITLIAEIQAATAKAFELNSVAARLGFDREKLGWELNFFKTHFFESFLKKPLSADDDAALSAEFAELAAELETRIAVLCHRDFHAANLMLDRAGRLRIIDHQDARMGAAGYDLVSLLLDRVNQPPPGAWIREKRFYFLGEREKLGLAALDPDDFAYEFRLQTIQRCLKATGTFSYQSIFRNKTYFIPYIAPTLEIVRQACERLDRFPNLRRVLKAHLEN